MTSRVLGLWEGAGEPRQNPQPLCFYSDLDLGNASQCRFFMPCSFVQIATITTLTALPHDEHIAALVLDRKEDLRHHNENPPLVRWVDCPHTVHVGRVIPRVVGRLDVACVFPQLASTDLI